MTGYGFLALVVSVFIATLLGFAWGSQWQREEQKVRDAFAADALERRRQAQESGQRQPAPRLPLYVAVPDTDAQRRRNAAMRQHPAGGSR